ncbi:YPDG domain-containing protein [Corynebacterium mendelii]|uniref:YPDG domain-containing protein n=1 Tax=Corynebacterium mendelii TaxID=2765362 RepID=A0A939E2K0_9CORY|nr:YPDG domain-containing protein [Corynebacterium mendelii]MBN9644322.1 YPDG domain-containing protein [Corynebacterium mendelii]
MAMRSLMALTSAAALTGTITPAVAAPIASSNESDGVCKEAPYWVVDDAQTLYRSTTIDLKEAKPVLVNGKPLKTGVYNYDIAAEGDNIYGIASNGNISVININSGDSRVVNVEYYDDDGTLSENLGPANALSIIDDTLYIGLYKTPYVFTAPLKDVDNPTLGGPVTATQASTDFSKFLTTDDVKIVGSGGDFLRAPNGELFLLAEGVENGRSVWYLATLGKKAPGKDLIDSGELIGRLEFKNQPVAAYGLTLSQGRLVLAGSDGWVYAMNVNELDSSNKEGRISLTRLAKPGDALYGAGSLAENDAACNPTLTTITYTDPEGNEVGTQKITASNNSTLDYVIPECTAFEGCSYVTPDDSTSLVTDGENHEVPLVYKLNDPAEPVSVADPAHLTDNEKQAVKDKVKEANPQIEPGSITVDDDGTVTVTGDPKYQDGEIPASVTVDALPRNEVYDPGYSPVSGPYNSTIASPVSFTREIDGNNTTNPVVSSYALDDTGPTDVTKTDNPNPGEGEVFINPVTGEVKFKPTKKQADSSFVFSVTVTYKDGTTDQTDAEITVDPLINTVIEPTGTSATTKPKQAVTAGSVGFVAKGTTTASDRPDNTIFAFVDTLPGSIESADSADNIQPGQAWINPTNGQVTFNPTDKQAGTTQRIPVMVTYPDTSTADTEAVITVSELTDKLVQPQPQTLVTTVNTETPAQPIAFNVQGTTNPVARPINAEFSLDIPEGLTEDEVQFNPSTGKIVFTPTTDRADSSFVFTVTVTYEDDSTDTTTVTYTVDPLSAALVAPSPQIIPAVADKPATSKTPQFVTSGTTEPAKAPDETTFSIDTDALADNVTPVDNPEEMEPGEVYIDPATGIVTFIPTKQQAGTSPIIPIVATYPDGSKNDTTITFTTAKLDKAKLDPNRQIIPAKAEKPATSAPIGFTTQGTTDKADPMDGDSFAFADMPDGVERVGSKDSVTQGTAFIDPETGEITFTPTTAQQGSSITFPVTVTYPDGSTDPGTIVFTVAKLESNLVEPASQILPAPLNETTDSQPIGFDKQSTRVPADVEGATFRLGTLPEGIDSKQVSIDANTGVVSFRPTGDQQGKSFVFPVTVKYADGSTDATTVTYTVAKSSAASVDPLPQTLPAMVDQSKSSDAPSFVKQGTITPTEAPEGTTYKLGDRPEGIDENQVSIDSTTGIVTFKPKLGQAGTSVTFPVTASYPDGTEDDTSVTYNVAQSTATLVDPQSQTLDAVVKKRATAATPGYKQQGTDNTVTAPDGARYALGRLPEGVAPDQVSIHPDTGAVTFTPELGQAGTSFIFPVTVKYADGSTDTFTDTFTVAKLMANVMQPGDVYTPAEVGVEAVAEAPAITEQGTINTAIPPTGTVFSLGTLPKGVEDNQVFIDSTTGAVTFTPNENQEGTTVDIPVVMTFPDSSTDQATSSFGVKATAPENDNQRFQPLPQTLPAPVGGTTTADVPGFVEQGTTTPSDVPAGTTYTIDFGKLPEGVDEDQFGIDNGKVSLTPTVTQAGTTISVPVIVTYADGTTDNTTVTFVVGRTQAESFEPLDVEKTAPFGEKTTSDDYTYTLQDGTTATTAPATKSFTLGDLPEGVDKGQVRFNTTTGQVTFEPDVKQAGQSFVFPVTVTYPDGSTDPVTAKFTVPAALSTLVVANPQIKEATPTESATSPAITFTSAVDDSPITDADAKVTTFTVDRNDVPGGIEFVSGTSAPDTLAQGQAWINPQTGEITFVPTLEQAGTSITVPVTVTYNDGTTAKTTVKFTIAETATVVEPNNEKAVAPIGATTTSDEVTYLDQAADTPVSGEDSPQGETYAIDEARLLIGVSKVNNKNDVTPGTVWIDPTTGAVTFQPRKEDSGQSVIIPATVTYTDGSTDPVTVTFTVPVSEADEFEPVAQNWNAPIGKAKSGTPIAFVDHAKGEEATGDNKPALTDESFSLGEVPEDLKVTIDQATGAVSFTPTKEQAGEQFQFPVTVTYKDGTTDSTMVTFTVDQLASVDYHPTSQTIPAKVGKKASSEDTGFTAQGTDTPPVTPPQDTKFTTTAPEGVTLVDSKPDLEAGEAGIDQATGKAWIDPTTGKVWFVPGTDQAGTSVDFLVTVTYRDGSTDTETTTFVVAKQDAALFEPVSQDIPAVSGLPATSAPVELVDPSGEQKQLPEGSTVAITGDGFAQVGSPDNIPVGKIYIDPATGEITYVATKQQAGTSVVVPVTVTYPDGTTDTAQVTFDVAPRLSVPNRSTPATSNTPVSSTIPLFINDTTGSTVVSPKQVDFTTDQAPKGYMPADSAETVGPGQYFLDSDSGVLTVTPRQEDAGKTLVFRVTVTFPDETTTQTKVSFPVAPMAKTATVVANIPQVLDAPVNKVTTSGPVEFHEKDTDKPFDIPQGTTHRIVGLPAGITQVTDPAAVLEPGQARIDPETGAISFLPAGKQANKKFKFLIVTKFADGSKDTTPVTFRVGSVAQPPTDTSETTQTQPGSSMDSILPVVVGLGVVGTLLGVIATAPTVSAPAPAPLPVAPAPEPLAPAPDTAPDVVKQPAHNDSAMLAVTGANVFGVTAGGLLTLLVGAVLVAANRRRRHQ